MGSAARRGTLVAACAFALLTFAGAAASQSRRAADLLSWQSQSSKLQISFQRDGMNGPIATVDIYVHDVPCDGGVPAVATGPVYPYLSALPVAADGTFSYDGPEERADSASRLQLSGRFNGRVVSGSFSYSGTHANGATCHTVAPVPFTATCDECPKPGGTSTGGGSAGGSALGSADRFVAFQQVGRAPLETTLAAFRARYPRDLWQGGYRDKKNGGQVAFFRLDRRSQPGDPHGLALMIRSNKAGRVWSEAAQTHDVGDRTSWLRGTGGVGIGSTLPELRKAFPGLTCGVLSAYSCFLRRDTPAGGRFMYFTFERSVRGLAMSNASGRVWALGVQCLGDDCKAHTGR